MSLKLSQFNFEGGPEDAEGMGMAQGCSLKGRPKTCDITDKIGHYLKDGFQHEVEPVVVRFFCPDAAAGSRIGDFGVNFIKGASKNAAALLVAEMAMISGVSKEQWDDKSRHCLESLVLITARYTGEASISELVNNVTLLKQRASETQRMDVIQLINVFGVSAEQLAKENPNSGKDFRELIIESINNFNRTTSVRNCKVEGNERQAVANLYSWGPESRKLVRMCWNEFKVKESPITVQLLATNFMQKKPPSAMQPNWKSWMEPLKSKMVVVFERAMSMYHAKMSQFNAARSTNARVQSAQFKEKLDDDMFFLCMCWGAWGAALKSKASPARWKEIEMLFYRGTLDECILGEMRRNNPEFLPEQFSFLRTADTLDVFARGPDLNLESQRAYLESLRSALKLQQHIFREWMQRCKVFVGTPASGEPDRERERGLNKRCFPICLYLSLSLSLSLRRRSPRQTSTSGISAGRKGQGRSSASSSKQSSLSWLWPTLQRCRQQWARRCRRSPSPLGLLAMSPSESMLPT